MLSHLFKLIWKKRRSNFLMMLEIFLSFLILFAVWSLLLYNYKTYAKPAGIQAENVWAVFVDFRADSLTQERMQQVKVQQTLASMAEVNSVSITANTLPYSFNSRQNVATYQKAQAKSTHLMFCDENYAKVLGLTVTEGRWLVPADRVEAKYPAAVINGHLRETLFGSEPALGKVIETAGQAVKVVGVVNDYKHTSEYSDDFSVFRMPPADHLLSTFLVQVKPGSGPDTEARVSKMIAQISRDASVEIQHLNDMRSNHNKLTFVPVLILLILSGFLIFNVALGITGVLWQAIQQRRGEIGIRRALGASQTHILRQFIGEIWVLAAIGMSLGIFLAVQFPILRVFDVPVGVYALAIALAALCILLLVTFCAWVPSRQASRIMPAVALHEN